MKAKLREKYLPVSHRKEEPLIHQFEPHKTNTPRYKSSPRLVPLSQPIPTIPYVHKSQPFPTTPVVPNSEPTPSLPLVQPKSNPRLVLLS